MESNRSDSSKSLKSFRFFSSPNLSARCGRVLVAAKLPFASLHDMADSRIEFPFCMWKSRQRTLTLQTKQTWRQVLSTKVTKRPPPLKKNGKLLNISMKIGWFKKALRRAPQLSFPVPVDWMKRSVAKLRQSAPSVGRNVPVADLRPEASSYRLELKKLI